MLLNKTVTYKSRKLLFRGVFCCCVSQGDQSTVPEGNTGANNTLHAFPFSLPYSGNAGRASGVTGDQATRGNFWSAAPSSTTGSRRLIF
ncbi:hypothetical protein IJI64_03135, partial [Candidatus Saccharibacteria bacterium]|nr:hypothetical protein [Candidatus Saccharibacteria bacterium]